MRYRHLLLSIFITWRKKSHAASGLIANTFDPAGSYSHGKLSLYALAQMLPSSLRTGWTSTSDCNFPPPFHSISQHQNLLKCHSQYDKSTLVASLSTYMVVLVIAVPSILWEKRCLSLPTKSGRDPIAKRLGPGIGTFLWPYRVGDLRSR